jgi:hypothetical protein
LSCPSSFGNSIVLSFFWSLYCLVLLLVIALSCPSFGHSIVLSFFFWSCYCLVLLLLVILLSCPSSFGHSIVLSFFFWSFYCLVLLRFAAFDYPFDIFLHIMYMLSGCELIDTENISLPRQNMKFGGESEKRTSDKLHILSRWLIFFSINHIHIQMTCLSSLNET